MKKQIAVVVTTSHRGVFFGYMPEVTQAKIVRIEKARMAVYWSADVRGIVGLAAVGPSKGCRIGPPAPAITLHDVTSVMECSDEATQLWENSPWSK